MPRKYCETLDTRLVLRWYCWPCPSASPPENVHPFVRPAGLLSVSCRHIRIRTYASAASIGHPTNNNSSTLDPSKQRGWFAPPGSDDDYDNPERYLFKCVGDQPHGRLREGTASDSSEWWCLYNVTADPCEYYDLSAEQPDTLERLRVALLAIRQRAVAAATSDGNAGCVEGVKTTLHGFHLKGWEPCDYEEPPDTTWTTTGTTRTTTTTKNAVTMTAATSTPTDTTPATTTNSPTTTSTSTAPTERAVTGKAVTATNAATATATTTNSYYLNAGAGHGAHAAATAVVAAVLGYIFS